jgi:hypothetical protein
MARDPTEPLETGIYHFRGKMHVVVAGDRDIGVRKRCAQLLFNPVAVHVPSLDVRISAIAIASRPGDDPVGRGRSTRNRIDMVNEIPEPALSESACLSPAYRSLAE